MKIFRYILALLLILGLAALVAFHLKREALARRIANDVLAGSGYTVGALSISRLRPDEILFSRLVLQGPDGARFDLRDLHVPLALPDTRVRQATIGRVLVAPAAAQDDAPPDYAGLLETALALPQRMPGVEVTVGEIEWPDWPRLRGIEWRTDAAGQQLAALLGTIGLRLATTTANGAQELRITARTAAGAPALRARFTVHRLAPGYRLQGEFDGEPAPWLGPAREAGLLPDLPLELAGAIAATADIALEAGGPGTIDAELGLGFDEAFEAKIAAAEGVDLILSRPGALSLQFAYPDGDWTAAGEAFDVTATYPGARQLAAHASAWSCVATHCELTLAGRADDVAAGGRHVGRLDVEAPVAVTLGDDWQVRARPAKLRLRQVRGAGWKIGDLKLGSASGLVVAATDGSIALNVDTATFDLTAMAFDAGLVGDLKVRLDKLAATTAPFRIDTRFDLPAAALKVAWQARPVVAAHVAGRIGYTGDRGGASLAVDDPARGLDARLRLDLEPAATTLTVDSASLSFDRAPLSRSWVDWPWPWDVVAGSATASGSLQWRGDSPLAAQGRLSLDNAAATWGELGATGIRADLPVRIEAGSEPVLGPADVEAALLDVGLPVSALAARWSWNLAEPAMEIERLSAGFLGGTVAASQAFRFEPGPMRGRVELSVDAIQLGLIPELAQLDSVEVTGSLSGMIPIAIDGDQVIVAGGRLHSESPGGVIRYRSQGAPGAASGLAIAQRALSNLQYESLASDVSYSETGDLVLKMRLKGINPDMDPLQPVILNLSVENNVPELLKSLQASRDIQDVIERRTRRAPAKPSQ